MIGCAPPEQFDVAVLDMQMPDMDGATLAREIARLRQPSQLPIVMVTSLGRTDVSATGAVFAAHLMKPLKPSTTVRRAGFRAGSPARCCGDNAPMPAETVLDPGMGQRCHAYLADRGQCDQPEAGSCVCSSGWVTPTWLVTAGSADGARTPIV
ncbi:MAG: response regulator [Anaerolineae bacterium]